MKMLIAYEYLPHQFRQPASKKNFRFNYWDFYYAKTEQNYFAKLLYGYHQLGTEKVKVKQVLR